ncbi:MAG: ferritin [Planctomycetes bacterium]|nr:ferritin [Planctomycetota bacterium]
MLSANLTQLLNQQIGLELYSVNLYRQMAAWCDHEALVGCAAFLEAHAEEENGHYARIFRYVRETGAKAVIPALPAPPTQWQDVAAVFAATLEHEQTITRSINAIVKAAYAENDFATVGFLQWFTNEQHEEEHLFRTVLDKARIIGTEGKSLYWLDKEIGKLAKGAAAN